MSEGIPVVTTPQAAQAFNWTKGDSDVSKAMMIEAEPVDFASAIAAVRSSRPPSFAFLIELLLRS